MHMLQNHPGDVAAEGSGDDGEGTRHWWYGDWYPELRTGQAIAGRMEGGVWNATTGRTEGGVWRRRMRLLSAEEVARRFRYNSDWWSRAARDLGSEASPLSGSDAEALDREEAEELAESRSRPRSVLGWHAVRLVVSLDGAGRVAVQLRTQASGDFAAAGVATSPRGEWTYRAESDASSMSYDPSSPGELSPQSARVSSPEQHVHHVQAHMEAYADRQHEEQEMARWRW